MGMLWGKRSKPEEPAAESAPAAKKEDPRTNLVAQPAEFFDTMRTSAFLNKNNIARFLQFWLAVKAENDKDEWVVTRYYVYKDAKDADGNGAIQSENASMNKPVVTFAEALNILGQAESMARQSSYMEDVTDVESMYPVKAFPFFEDHFHSVEHFVRVANVEGYVFDDLFRPHNRTRGLVIADDADFTHEQFKPIDPDTLNAKAMAYAEGGVIRDVFRVAATKVSKLEDNMRAFGLLKHTDDFAFQAGVFFVSMQKAMGLDPSFNDIRGMTPDLKKTMLARTSKGTADDFDAILSTVIPKMTEVIQECKSQNVKAYTEPFEKFVAECEMYVYMVKSDRAYRPMKAAAEVPGGVSVEAMAEVRENVEAAKKKFVSLGGSDKHAKMLEAWVYNPDNKTAVNDSFSEFLSRYYEARQKAVARFSQKGFKPEADMAEMTDETKPTQVTEKTAAKQAPKV